MHSFLPTVVTAAFIALAYAAPVQTGEIEVLQYGMIVLDCMIKGFVRSH